MYKINIENKISLQKKKKKLKDVKYEKKLTFRFPKAILTHFRSFQNQKYLTKQIFDFFMIF